MAEPRFDVTTVGEVMVRLSVPVGQRLELATTMDVQPGGAEANVVVALAQLGRRAAWVSGLPQNPLGRLIANRLRAGGVDLGGVVWAPTGRVGAYYVEFAAPPRAIQVVYDRADSVASQLGPGQVDWDYLLDTRLVHVTGITTAISPTCRALVVELVKRARAAGTPVSFDVNYRSKLWTEAECARTLRPLIEGVDLLFCGQRDARGVFKISGEGEDLLRGLRELTGAKTVVTTFGDQGARAWDGQTMRHERALPMQMVDRLGAGDALAAGVVHGWLDGDTAQGLRYGVVLAALALGQFGDMVTTTPQEVESLLAQTGDVIAR